MTTVPEGYYRSPWPAEDGGPARLQVPHAPMTLGLAGGRTLRMVRRRAHFATMTVLRDPGEIYLLSHTMLRHRALGMPSSARVERIDPLSLQPLARSPVLRGGPAWPGGIAVHRNGDIYVVYGRWCHRLGPDCALKASLSLPRERPYNSFVILDDGTLVSKDFSDTGDSMLVCIDPETLSVIGHPLRCPEPAIARLSARGDTVYVVGVDTVFRYHWDRAGMFLREDDAWRWRYREDPQQGYGWDAVLDGQDCWFMDNGRHRYFLRMTGAGVDPGAVKLLRVSLSDPADHERHAVSGKPFGAITNPPLVDPVRRIVVGYDSANTRLRAWRILPGTRALEPLWDKPRFAAASHLLLLGDSGEMLVNDHSLRGEQLVVLAIDSGNELGRVRTGGLAQGVVFPGVGWNGDLLHASFDSLVRLWAE